MCFLRRSVKELDCGRDTVLQKGAPGVDVHQNKYMTLGDGGILGSDSVELTYHISDLYKVCMPANAAGDVVRIQQRQSYGQWKVQRCSKRRYLSWA